ncbi:MAG: hypothetical protein MK082_11790 [Phycisphaerales bacterium]|nr:hypothetical protein [Phycisphaerales bacterium]
MRILLLTIVFGGVVGTVLWQGFLSRERALLDEIGRLETIMAEEVALRDAMIGRLERTTRMARVEVLDQTMDEDQVITDTTFRFVELDEDGAELDRREYTLPGEVVFIDAWTIRFDHEQVASGDPFAGQSLVLFKRVYSDQIPPSEGLPIDTPGGIPNGYAVSNEARFEQAMWTQFWRMTGDPETARRHGVRVAQGEAVYKPVRTGQVFDLVAESAGGLTMVPVDLDAPEEGLVAASAED